MVNRVERHIFVNNDILEELCRKAKLLYNYTNFQIRFSYFTTGKLPKEYDLVNWFTEEDQPDYRGLPAQTSQQIIKLLYKNWKAYFKALKSYKKNPNKFKAKPKLHGYKKKFSIAIFTNQQVKLKDGYIYFPKRCEALRIKTNVDNVQQVRIIPQHNVFVVEVVYKKEVIVEDLNEDLYLGIDLGVDNLATLTTSSLDNPLLVNGKVIKSINQFFNKTKAKLQSYIGKGTSKRINHLNLKRNNKIQNYLHHTSKFIISYCVQNKIKNIIIGYNVGWKQEINIGKANNQKFVSIPFLTLINQIKYKAENVGIKVITINEAYTSKCDALALETVEKHEKYAGKRIRRGLFQSSIGKWVNADVNGSLNILRKVISDDFLNLANKSCVSQPERINPLKVFVKFSEKNINYQGFNLILSENC